VKSASRLRAANLFYSVDRNDPYDCGAADGGFFDDSQLVLVDADTFNEHVISNGIDRDYGGAWSPDGTQIAFTRNGKSIWIADADGNNGHQLVSDQDNLLLEPAWSHDGTRIAYAYTSTNGSTGAIYTVPVGGSAGANHTSGIVADPPIAWSPDDHSLLFVGVVGTDTDVYAADLMGGGYRNLSNRSGRDGRTSVSWMDQNSIVFDASHIWTMAADGSNQQNLTGTTHTESQASWSAATSKIYYVVDDNDIYVMNRNGTGQHQVSDGTGNSEPQASPDGTQLAFTSRRDGSDNVYVSGANGETPTRATNTGTDFRPRWRPCL